MINAVIKEEYLESVRHGLILKPGQSSFYGDMYSVDLEGWSTKKDSNVESIWDTLNKPTVVDPAYTF